MKGRVFLGDDERRGRGPSLLRVLVSLLGPPVLWALHLGISYIVLTLDCISAWNGAGWALAVLTALFAGMALYAGWLGWEGRRLGAASAGDGEWDWDRVLLTAGVGSSALFTLVIVAEGVAPYFVSFCP